MFNAIRAAIHPLYLLLFAVLITLAGGAAALIGAQFAYANRAFPGVRLQGTDVSGLPPETIMLVAQSKGMPFRAPLITLRVGEQSVTLRLADLGMDVDPAATIDAVLSVGRSGDLAQRIAAQAQAWWSGADVAPVVRFEEPVVERLLAALADETRRDPRNAAIQFDGGAAREVAAENGAALDTAGAMSLIRGALATGKPAELTLPVAAIPPRVASAASAAADAARITGQDLVLSIPRWAGDGSPLDPVESLRIRGADLATYLSVSEVADAGASQLAVRLDRDRLRPMVEPLAAAVNQAAENARFEFDDATASLRLLSPGRDQRALDVDATLAAVEAALNDGGSEHRATAVVSVTPAPVPAAATAQQLGITGLITQATTYFKGSSAPRLANIKVAAARFHGVTVPPGETFSFNQFLGEVSTEEGFEEGLIIVGDRTLKGVGGGVCQVSTTAYQAALRAGFPIQERYPHGYRVSYYERGMGPGFDAAVFSPIVDMKFVNDTAGHLLVETYYDAARATLTFKFYGAPDGRQVAFTQPEIANVAPHGPDIYEPAPEGEVPAGKAKQVEYAVDGATIVFHRQVTRDGQLLIDERVVSKYAPWQARFQFGPEFTPPEGAEIAAQP